MEHDSARSRWRIFTKEADAAKKRSLGLRAVLINGLIRINSGPNILRRCFLHKLEVLPLQASLLEVSPLQVSLLLCIAVHRYYIAIHLIHRYCNAQFCRNTRSINRTAQKGFDQSWTIIYEQILSIQTTFIAITSIRITIHCYCNTLPTCLELKQASEKEE